MVGVFKIEMSKTLFLNFVFRLSTCKVDDTLLFVFPEMMNLFWCTIFGFPWVKIRTSHRIKMLCFFGKPNGLIDTYMGLTTKAPRKLPLGIFKKNPSYAKNLWMEIPVYVYVWIASCPHILAKSTEISLSVALPSQDSKEPHPGGFQPPRFGPSSCALTGRFWWIVFFGFLRNQHKKKTFGSHVDFWGSKIWLLFLEIGRIKKGVRYFSIILSSQKKWQENCEEFVCVYFV